MTKHPFVMFPTRIWNLPGITLQLLKFYEKIFQFWHQNHECFIGNKALMEYAGMKSDSTVRDAFRFFESQGEMKRVNKNGQRYIIPPQPKVKIDEDPVDKLPRNSPNISHTSATALGGERHSAGTPSATALPNNINLIKQNNKSFCLSDEQKKNKAMNKSSDAETTGLERRRVDNEKKHSWSDKPKAPFADVEGQSTSYNPDIQNIPKATPECEGYKKFRDSNPYLRNKHAKPENNDPNETNKLATRTKVQSKMASEPNAGSQGVDYDVGRGKPNPPPLRSPDGLLEARSARVYFEKAGLASEQTECRL